MKLQELQIDISTIDTVLLQINSICSCLIEIHNY